MGLNVVVVLQLSFLSSLHSQSIATLKHKYHLLSYQNSPNVAFHFSACARLSLLDEDRHVGGITCIDLPFDLRHPTSQL